jgi:soluble lytic murein transglycosylase-like protein
MANDYQSSIIQAATAAGIDPAIALAVAQQESGVEHYTKKGAVKVSRAGAIGIMQVMPATAPGRNLADPQQNIQAGVAELARLHRAFAGNWELALAAYNWGQGRVQDALRGLRTVPYEVKEYVEAILRPGKLTLRWSNTLAAVGGTHPAHQIAREHPGLIALGVVSLAVVVIRILR